MRVQQSAAAADLGPDPAAASRHPPDGAGVVVASVQGVAEILTYTLQFPPAFPV